MIGSASVAAGVYAVPSRLIGLDRAGENGENTNLPFYHRRPILRSSQLLSITVLRRTVVFLRGCYVGNVEDGNG